MNEPPPRQMPTATHSRHAKPRKPANLNGEWPFNRLRIPVGTGDALATRDRVGASRGLECATLGLAFFNGRGHL